MKKRNNPKISVVMSVFNGQDFLKEAIESILEQSFTNFEFIIIDDASTDGTTEILESFKKRDKRIKIIRNKKNLNLSRSLNKGLRQAQGEFIARMDADDISEKNRLKIQANFLKKNPKVAFCGSWVILINQSGKKIGERKYPTEYREIKKIIMHYNPFIHPTVMIKREILEKMGFYDFKLNAAGDYDLFLRMVKNYQAINLPKFLLKYRISRQAMSFLRYKKMEKEAIWARWKAIRQYGYPRWQLLYLGKPVISFLIPGFLKRFFYQQRFGE